MQNQKGINEDLIIPVVPHEAVPEVSKKYSIYKSEEQVPIEIVFDMLGFNMLNPKMKNHPPFVLPRLSYSSTTLYYTILLQYYSVLQSTIPVLLCTTKYYSSTSLYYKVLLQYYSVLQSTTPVLLCTTHD